MNQPLSIEQLESKHPHFCYLEPLWKDLSILYEGGVALDKNLNRLLPKRPGEEKDLYELRLDKTTYNNILAKGVNTLVNKLASGELNVTNSDDAFWVNFRKDVDLHGTGEIKFIQDLFKELLLYGKAFIQVDRTTTPYQPRNAYEEAQLGLRSYLTTYSACEVIDWGYDNQGNLTFIKVAQEFPHRINPFSPLVWKKVYTYITDELVVKYEYFINDKRDSLVSELGEVIDEFSDNLVIKPSLSIEHKYGGIPVKELKLDRSEWVCGLVLHKLLEAFRIENQITDAISVGCQLQRTYKPYREPFDADGTFQEITIDEIKLGNAYVAKVDDYKIVEMEGSAVRTSMERLREIEQSLFNQLTFNVDRYQNMEHNEASGISKEIDHDNQHSALQKYGSLLRQAYQTVLGMVARIENKASVPVIHGLSDFKVHSINDMLLLAQALKTCSDLLPVRTLKEFSKRFSKIILDTSNPDLLEEAEREIEEMDFLIKQKEASESDEVARGNPKYASGENIQK